MKANESGQIIVSDVNQVIESMREELDDHLVAINENTEEIELNYSYVLAFNERLKLVEQKIEQLIKIFDKEQHEEQKIKFKKIRITEAEQKIFSLFYNTDRAMSYSDVEEESGVSKNKVKTCLNSLIEKGVPVYRFLTNKKQYYYLDAGFKQLQCKENILQLDKTLTLDCFDQNIGSN